MNSDPPLLHNAGQGKTEPQRIGGIAGLPAGDDQRKGPPAPGIHGIQLAGLQRRRQAAGPVPPQPGQVVPPIPVRHRF